MNQQSRLKQQRNDKGRREGEGEADMGIDILLYIYNINNILYNKYHV